MQVRFALRLDISEYNISPFASVLGDFPHRTSSPGAHAYIHRSEFPRKYRFICARDVKLGCRYRIRGDHKFTMAFIMDRQGEGVRHA